MKPYETLAHIHSLNGEMGTVTVLDKNSDGTQTVYIVDYKGIKTRDGRAGLGELSHKGV